MTCAQVDKTSVSVTTNSSSQDYTHLDGQYMGNIKEKVNVDTGVTERITDVILYGCLSFPMDCMATALKVMTLP